MGDLDNAIHLHQIFTELWRKYHAIPEVYDFHEKNIIADYYLLRPYVFYIVSIFYCFIVNIDTKC